MTKDSITSELEDFRDEYKINSKGRLAGVVTYSVIALDEGLPIDPESIATNSQGQVSRLSGGNTAAALARFGEERFLAKEGGRTTRGNLGIIRAYMELLNRLHAGVTDFDMESVCKWWVGQVSDFLDAKPITLKKNSRIPVSRKILSIIDEAARREQAEPGSRYVGGMIQHLVGAKLEVLGLIGEEEQNESAAAADEPTNRSGDFFVGNSAIHVTTHSSNDLLRRCQDNIDADERPIIITTGEGITHTRNQLRQAGMSDKVEVLGIEEFLATNLLEWADFTSSKHTASFDKLIEAYNRRIENANESPAIRVEMK